MMYFFAAACISFFVRDAHKKKQKIKKPCSHLKAKKSGNKKINVFKRRAQAAAEKSHKLPIDEKWKPHSSVKAKTGSIHVG